MLEMLCEVCEEFFGGEMLEVFEKKVGEESACAVDGKDMLYPFGGSVRKGGKFAGAGL